MAIYWPLIALHLKIKWSKWNQIWLETTHIDYLLLYDQIYCLMHTLVYHFWFSIPIRRIHLAFLVLLFNFLIDSKHTHLFICFSPIRRRCVCWFYRIYCEFMLFNSLRMWFTCKNIELECKTNCVVFIYPRKLLRDIVEWNEKSLLVLKQKHK